MHTWGRTYNEDGTFQWVEVTTDANGNNDAVWLTTLIQCLKLNPGESPFYANYGVPSYQSIVTQVFPDFYVSRTQAQFAPYFASLTITKITYPSPYYDVNVTTHAGATIAVQVPV